MRQILSILLIFLNLNCFSQVKREISTEFWFVENNFGIKIRKSQLYYFSVFDKKGNEIESGMYGENHGWTVIDTLKNGEIAVSHYDSWDYSKISSVNFNTYNEKDKIIKEETWFFKNNKKNWFAGYKIFSYSTKGLIEKEIEYSDKDVLENTRIYVYDKFDNNIEIIDSAFIPSGNKTPNISVHRVVNEFDSLNRQTLSVEYSNNKFLLKKLFLYSNDNDIITELRYNNETNSCLWSISETKNGNPRYYCFGGKKKLEKFKKIINSSIEERDLYIYNKKCELMKIEHYSGIELVGYTKFKYEYY